MGHLPRRGRVERFGQPEQLARQVIEAEGLVIQFPFEREGISGMKQHGAHLHTRGDAARQADRPQRVEPVRILQHGRFQRGGRLARRPAMVGNALGHPVGQIRCRADRFEKRPGRKRAVLPRQG